MNRRKQHEIYQAQCDNLRVLEGAWKHIKRSIHRDILSNNETSVQLQTKLLALTYSAWAETSFYKLIHTPYGFDLDEITQIKRAIDKQSIVAGWRKAVSLALRKVASKKSNYVPNVKLTIERLVSEYIEKPSQLRNKIAHGQWVVGLNSKSTDLQQNITTQLASIDIVKLDLWKETTFGLCKIIENLIESPNKSFQRDYWPIINATEEKIKMMSTFTYSDKVLRLKAKKSHANT